MWWSLGCTIGLWRVPGPAIMPFSVSNGVLYLETSGRLVLDVCDIICKSESITDL